MQKFNLVTQARILLCLFGLLLTSSTAFTQDAYVNPAGICNGGTPCFTTIGAAVAAASAGDIIQVEDGTYNENVTIDKALTLQSENGRTSTTVQGADGNPALGTIFVSSGTSNVTIDGFTIVGYDAANPGLEEAGIYLQGATTNINISNNEVVANGEAGLLTEFNAAINMITVDNNIFSGQTFVGATPAGCGFGDQFTLLNVPRQLVAIQGNNSMNVTFTNNTISGTAGGPSPGCNSPVDYQGNTLVTIDVTNATITNNVFNGTTGRFATMLRARGTNTTISGNTFDGTNLGPVAGYLFVDGDALDGAEPSDLEGVLDANMTVPEGFVSGGSVVVCTPPDAFTTAVFDDPHCYGEPNNSARRAQVGPNTLPGADQEVVWEIVSFTPFPGSDNSAFVGQSFTNADNATTSDEFGIFNSGRSLRFAENATGVNGMPIFGTYVANAYVRDVPTGCTSEPFEVTKVINGVPDVTILPFDGNPYDMVCADEQAIYLSSALANGDFPVESYTWTFSNDNSMPMIVNGAGGTGSGQLANDNTPRRIGSTWSEAGMETVMLEVLYENGCTTTAPTLNVTINDVAAPTPATTSKAFCQSEELAANLANTGVNVSSSLSANEKVVWMATSVPPGSAYAAGDLFTTDDCGDPFKNFGELAVANTSKVIRVNDPANAPIGTYTFDAYIENCETGCTSDMISGFSITVNAAPSVMIMADPEGDLCLGQTGVQYNADITSTDGGTYSYMWCAYNSGDGSGTCFNGFSDNTAAMPTRDWTSSAGDKSVGVMVMSDVPGCAAEDLYSFEVVAPTMLECPDDIMTTLETDSETFDCATDITFNHPMVMPGPCDPVNLTLEITGPSGAGPEMVTPGEEYVFTVEELGEYTVTYNLSDAVGNTSVCSFNITVGGLPCGFVDNGGIGECEGMNTSVFDQETEAFSVTSNGCVPEFPYIMDNQAYVFSQLCGDGYIKVFVEDIASKGIAGIQLRESEAPGAKKVEIATDLAARIFKAVRVLDNYPAFPQEVFSTDKFWLKIERMGNVFRASASVDDVTYIPYLFQSVNMGECLTAGMFVTSTNAMDVATANFTNLEIVETMSTLQGSPQTIAQSNAAQPELSISLAPNPTKDVVNIQLDQLIGETATISIFNINGQLMNSLQLDRIENVTETIDISNLPAGTYYVNVRTATVQQTMKLMKQ